MAVSLLGIVGCGNDSATTNTTNEFDEQHARDNIILTQLLVEEQETFAKKGKGARATETDATVEESQTPDYAQAHGQAKYTDKGFEIDLDFGIQGVGVKLKFPANAVSESTASILSATGGMITITGEAVMSSYGSYVYFYECLPHGLVFDNPVAVNQYVREANNTAMGLFYNTNGKWYSLEEVSGVSNGVVKFNMWHFSKYGVSR
jgi:hypothetical protein